MLDGGRNSPSPEGCLTRSYFCLPVVCVCVCLCLCLQGMSEDDIEVVLDKGIMLFRYLQEKVGGGGRQRGFRRHGRRRRKRLAQ